MSRKPAFVAATLCALLTTTPVLAQVADVPAEEPQIVDDSEEASDDLSATDEIIVTAPRLFGGVTSDIKADYELDEAAIASYGASSVTELLSALAPQTTSGRGRGGGGPVVLLNGRRISGFGEIRNLPPEAIARVEVFPEEVALEYGYAADQRVVNFVLKPNFQSISASVEAGLATQGGRGRTEVESSYLRIGDKGRVNLTGVWESNGLLAEAERNIAGTDAAVRSLLPQTDRYALDLTVSRALTDSVDGTINLNVEQNDSAALLGLGALSGDVLARDSGSRSYTAGASLSGRIDKWRWTATGNANRAVSNVLTDRNGAAGIITNPDRNRTVSETLAGNFTTSGTLIQGWAGPVRTTFSTGFDSLDFSSLSERSGVIATSALGRDTINGRATVIVPLTDPEYGGPDWLGRVGLNSNVGVSDLSDFGSLVSWGAGLDWSPTSALSVQASLARDEAAPSVQQLGATNVINPGQTYYDFTTGQTVVIDTVSGGNAGLLAERRRDIKLGASYAHPDLKDLQFSVNWNRNRSYNTSNSFPLLTPEIEAAFPGRVTRDADGNLTRLDLRPVNYARTATEQIRWGVNFSKSFGQSEGGPGGMGGGPRGPRPDGAGPGSGGPRAGGGGPRGGGGGMGPMGGGSGGRWNVSLYHTWKLDDRILIASGIPELDLLDGSATGSSGGSPRHSVELDGGWFNKGIGFRLSGKYDNGSTVDGGTTDTSLDFAPLATVNLRAFVNFDQQAGLLKSMPFLKGSRIRLSFDNIFDAQRKVTDGAGAVPIRYLPGYTDPLGRYVEIDFRKLF